jgi:DNA phosphorothioation-associated putative methyltransferase
MLQAGFRRGATALGRSGLSRPAAVALEAGLLPDGATFFDYGCGRGDDVRRLAALGYETGGWDPAHRADAPLRPGDIVNFGYVANVIEDQQERAEALRNAWTLSKQVLVVAARCDWEEPKLAGRLYADGILTRKGTFQKFFTQEELRDWIDATLEVHSLAAAPGIFFVFRDEARAQAFLAARVRHRPRILQRQGLSEALYERNRDVLDHVVSFIQNRGRAPEGFELSEADAIRDRFGSLDSALKLLRRVLGNEFWIAARAAATEDLLVYLALAAFGGRPKVGALPEDIRLDVKAAFGSYKNACEAADNLLFKAGDEAAIDRACRDSAIGKLTREALYVHSSCLSRLSSLLRVYEGCARTLAGSVEGTTLIKLHHDEPKISYLVYPVFDHDPHPALAESVRVDLKRQTIRIINFREWDNPPVLHRKEAMVSADYPGRQKFARLTVLEDRLGLLADPASIGTRDRWQERVRNAGYSFHGHRLTRRVEPS